MESLCSPPFAVVTLTESSSDSRDRRFRPDGLQQLLMCETGISFGKLDTIPTLSTGKGFWTAFSCLGFERVGFLKPLNRAGDNSLRDAKRDCDPALACASCCSTTNRCTSLGAQFLVALAT